MQPTLPSAPPAPPRPALPPTAVPAVPAARSAPPRAAVPRLPRRHRSGFAPATVFEAALTDLSADGATGALHGSAGTVHLVDGAVVHAESPATPDVGTLLTSAGRLSARTWADVLAAHREHPAADHLVATGRIGRGELELCQLTAVLDAAFFALPQNDGPIGFLPGVRPGITLHRPLAAGALRLAVARRRTLLDRTWPDARLDAAAIRALPPGSGAHRAGRSGSRSGRRRAVLAAADGFRTPSQIARLLGRSAYTTLLDIRHLAAAGLVETPAPAGPVAAAAAEARAAAAAPVVPPDPSSVPPAAGAAVSAAVPPGAAVQARPQVLLPSPGAHDFPPDPEIALLLRIRAALEARL
ncbi:hypothetical protein KNE206_01770 [Kitasatospora sp. NE20-6]